MQPRGRAPFGLPPATETAAHAPRHPGCPCAQWTTLCETLRGSAQTVARRGLRWSAYGMGTAARPPHTRGDAFFYSGNVAVRRNGPKSLTRMPGTELAYMCEIFVF